MRHNTPLRLEEKTVKQGSLNKWEKFKCKRKARRTFLNRKRKQQKKERDILAKADHAEKTNLVINFSDVTIPKFTMAILSYGPGFIPVPNFNKLQFRLDAANTANKLAWQVQLGNQPKTAPDIPPALMKKDITAPCVSKDKCISTLCKTITEFADNLIPSKPPPNLNRFEREGFKWLKSAVSQGKLI